MSRHDLIELVRFYLFMCLLEDGYDNQEAYWLVYTP